MSNGYLETRPEAIRCEECRVATAKNLVKFGPYPDGHRTVIELCHGCSQDYWNMLHGLVSLGNFHWEQSPICEKFQAADVTSPA